MGVDTNLCIYIYIDIYVYLRMGVEQGHTPLVNLVHNYGKIQNVSIGQLHLSMAIFNSHVDHQVLELDEWISTACNRLEIVPFT